MTREEAIKVLSHIIESYKTFPAILCKIPYAEERKNEYVDALKVAIEALSAPQTDLISRADAVKAIVSWESEVADNVPYAREVFEIMAKREHEILNAIERVPSVSADRPIGEWMFDIYDARGKATCKNCGNDIIGYGKTNLPFYCPNCGARMKGGAE